MMLDEIFIPNGLLRKLDLLPISLPPFENILDEFRSPDNECSCAFEDKSELLPFFDSSESSY